MELSLVVAFGSSVVAGFCLAVCARQARGRKGLERRVRERLGGKAARPAPAASAGQRESPVLAAVVRLSGPACPPWLGQVAETRLWGAGLGDAAALLARAGLADAATPAGTRAVRVAATGAGIAFGALAGAAFSGELAAVLAVAGGIAGFSSVPAALKSRASARNADMERHLSQMVEVVVLGLRSGLSFERAFSLYPRYFDTGLAESMGRVARRWELGLSSREEALRALEAEYDSALLSRVVGSMVRSLRFGTSVADSLEAAAVEAREVHRARMEERVAKVAVKMMLPVGALILPAMLLLVMGPVMLELVQGF